MRTNLTALLSFGMVFCPVGIATSSKRREIEFRNLHKKCEQPVNEIKRCNHCDMSLSSEDMIKGYEVAKGQYVKFTEDEVAILKGARTPKIEITKFVEIEEITANMIEKSYLLVPKAAQRVYEILGYTLMAKNYAGLGVSRLWGKESPVAVVSDEGVLNLRMLYCADEVRSDAEIVAALNFDLSEDEVELAGLLMDQMKGSLTTEDLHNATRAAFEEAVEMKLAGKELAAPEESEEVITPVDALTALRESYEQVLARR